MKMAQSKKDWAKLSEIFGFTPNMCGITSMSSGQVKLDVVVLHDRLCVPDNVSVKDHIQNKYGDEALRLTKALI